jgi:hypothetical protein
MKDATKTIRTPSAEFMLVTPELAAQWLASNPDNYRRLDRKKVAQYREDIANDHWHLNGETIKLTLDEKLTDGQHRCKAIVDTKKSVLMLVVWTDETAGVDRGKPRSFVDYLTRDGVKNAGLAATAIRNLYLMHVYGELPVNRNQCLSDDTLYDFYAEHLDAELLQIAIHRGQVVQRQRITSKGTWATVMYLFVISDADLANQFHDGIVSGANLDSRSPILTLRTRYINAQLVGKGSGARPSLRHMMAFAIKAWNAFKSNKQLGTIKFLDTEPFPTID